MEFILRNGDIDNREGTTSDRDAMMEGSRMHRKLQSQMGAGYLAEKGLSLDVDFKECILRVEGRADGIFSEDGLTYIDEIKTMYRDVTAFKEPDPLHLSQAKCYAYLWALTQNQEEDTCPFMGVQMTYCNLESEEIRRFRQTFSYKELEAFFEDLTGRFHRWTKRLVEWKQIRQASIRQLKTLPFDWRPGQKEVADCVYRTIVRGKKLRDESRDGNKLFIQAPTGTGKTLSTVFPSVKAIGEGLADCIFYATAKTVTRKVAEEAFDILRSGGLHMKTVTLTAKEKICFLDEPSCNPDACPYAKGHYDRINDAVFELLSQKEVLDRCAIEEQAEKWQVCPYEMGMDLAYWADTVICDYNYIFDPYAKLKRIFGEGTKKSTLFLIDEAHNLVERGREMFSASLYREDFLALKKEIHSASTKVEKALARCNTWFLKQRRLCENVRILDGEDAKEELGTFPLSLMNLGGVIEDFLDEARKAKRSDLLVDQTLDLYFKVMRFLQALDRLDENYVVYTECLEDGRFLLRLFCVDISENLQECLNQVTSTIYFSATLLPGRYYKSLLSTSKDDYAIYAKPFFDPANRLVMIGTDTTTRYTDRGPGQYGIMADYVLKAVRAHLGNYMVFFSSYQMMDDVADRFEELVKTQEGEIEILRQKMSMSERERDEFLEHFDEAHGKGLVGFCVMGGIFGEGIDLREDRLIGVIIVGTGIPQICNEREILKDFYDSRGEDGFFYAYLCPGMNRVLQSAGRLIRTESDRGIVLLLDTRFDNRRYRSLFPAEWGDPGTCTIETVEEKLEDFWENQGKS